MRRFDYGLCLWPGLPPLWREGRASGLLWAVLFGVLLNVTLTTTLVWPGIFISEVKAGLGLTTILAWMLFLGHQVRTVSRGEQVAQTPAANQDALFIQAQTEYLKGNWEETEWLLRQRLSTAPRDIESRLLLATNYRRQSQPHKALEQLRLLRKWDDALVWREEIERETRRLETSGSVTEPPESSNAPVSDARDSTLSADGDMIDTNRVRRAA